MSLLEIQSNIHFVKSRSYDRDAMGTKYGICSRDVTGLKNGFCSRDVRSFKIGGAVDGGNHRGRPRP